jgi:lipopolysaccharide/colanic/teichoic acid biosynthesis glycosyltransferase
MLAIMLHTLSTAFAGVRRLFGQKRHLDGLPTAAQMRKVLERERSRADRTGGRLSVVAFAARSLDVESITLTWLVKILQGRLRSIDEIGWLDERHICAVLPGADPLGAERVVAHVCLNFPVNVAPPVTVVYSYPSDPVDGERDSAASGDMRQDGSGETASLDVLLLQPLPLWKRGLDVTGASVGLLFLAPVMGMIALAIKVCTPGPIFFRQRRTGRNGRPFLIYKFRTMAVNAEARQADLLAQNERDGPAFKIKNDPRITWLGRLLRTTSLDELPQLWNVLRGDMSLVGPRPLPCAESEKCVGWQRHRLDAMPGLTCIWQVRGRGGVSFADWVRMDVQYIRSRSFWQDLKLLLLTVPAVVLRKGAH